MNNKRDVSLLIPYKIKDEEIFVYLQKRTQDAKQWPDCYGFFGGGIKNSESPEEALQREIMEEMNFMPRDFDLLGVYESEQRIRRVFILEVDDDFEKILKFLRVSMESILVKMMLLMNLN